MVLPTGEILRTGNLTLPESAGTMPHSHGSDFGRICTGSLGTTGVVSLLTTKLKAEPEERKIFFLTSEKAKEILNAVKSIVRYCPIEIGEEHITLNNLCLSSLLATTMNEFENLVDQLPPWTHILSLTGKEGWVDCQEKDLMDASSNIDIKPVPELKGSSNAPREFADEFSLPTRIDRAFKYLPYNRIEFYTTINQFLEFKEELKSISEQIGYGRELGICIIPIEQARSIYVEYDIYFDPSNPEELNKVKNLYKAFYSYLIRNGAIINVPHDFFVAEQIYSRTQIYYETMLKIKKMIDPNDIMHPGKLFI